MDPIYPFSFNLMPEIEDEIFELAARNNPPDAPNLSVISKRVQPRIEAIMYATIVFISDDERFQLRNMTYVERFLDTLHSRPAKFFATHVRNVCITNTVPKDAADLIFSKCTGIQNLAIWQRRNPVKVDIVASVTPFASTLLSFSAGRSSIRQLTESGSIFPNMKHLAIGVFPVDIPLPNLDSFPALTTLQLDLEQQPFSDEQWVLDVWTALSTAPQLQTLLLDVNSLCLDDVTAQVLEFSDGRIVVRNEHRFWDPITEWMEIFDG